ncbi:DNA primase [Bathymodiolus heckerae thiotrophic gill symbiont]|uniref:DNA primase n=1 Tax=Bathymodiolus heckerae thiotrophic gill symbiont TaxID=1052212 RepID=UPI0010B66A0F|nr:DNA primase [Bathymodiolus heckerae thiotrophic gill symbiont]CAC9437588.1 DNA primase DnaG [uncultured Gammaproteobacteria bacterium]SMN13896.1 DNA primase [Bathymodiolus heckerae thiotrophic gill symbiont]
MPYISQNFINDLPNQIDIVDLIGKRLTLKKMGSGYRAPCPFHGGKNPNFAVNSHEQFYHCFKCGESGGAISFMQKYENLSFPEAVEAIANEFGLVIEYDSNSKPADPKLERYRELSQKVSDFYAQQLKASPAKEKAVTYAKDRGISGEIAKRFALGFAPPSNKDLLLNFEQNEQATLDLKALGLIKTGEYGDYDFFRDRLMFPIHSSKGAVIAFGGRAFDNNAKAKYLNSQESPIFSKSRELYGLYHARKHSRSMDYILVVEGYMDVVALHQSDITKVVATLGTATTEQHLQTLARTTNNIVFCFDGDDAGRVAAWKALKIALPIIKSGLQIKFLFLPDGEDPDTLVKKESTQAFEVRISNAYPLSKFLFEHIQAEVDFDTIEGKTLFLEEVTALIALVTHDVYQLQLLEGVAQIVGQSVEQVMAVFTQQTEKVQEKSQLQAPIDMEYESFMPDFSDEYSMPNISSQENNSVKVLMGRMISLLLNYPLLANDTVEVRVRNIEKSQVLLDLVHSAQMDEEISQESLIKPFKSKLGVYQRLQKLCTLEPFLSENQARDEFLSALNNAEKRQEITKVKGSIASAKTLEDQQKVMEGIAKSKSRK